MQLRTLTTATLSAALALFATTAYAQDPEAGDTGQWQQPNNNGQNNGWGQPNGNGGQPPQGNGNTANTGNGQWNNGQNNAQQPNGNGNTNPNGGTWAQDNEHAGTPHGAGGEDSTGISAPSDWNNADNHSAAVHHLGIGFFGVLQIPTHDDLSPTGPFSSVAAPTIGGRYWINDLIGFEGALGIGFNSPTVTMGGVSVSAGTNWGVGFHVGLPLAVAHWKHFAFIIQPEVDLGIGGGDDGGDYSFSGFLFRIGGRLGAEIHMGFIGIPQLSLQAGVGLHLTYQSGNSLFGPSATGDHGASVFSIGTSIEKNPWDWFTGNITAIYYL